ncbi:glycerophosphodiester phosphodiesterase [Streptomyces uncialis]|uniref:glycerophosphodiester phosphodiesterase n=1 Tax=Streptomyces uncialis TaxID=1048205 RepID=UPI00386B177C|nr:glycerophosphodiester phosphodiesterase family protein [Streptomyces uncialis]
MSVRSLRTSAAFLVTATLAALSVPVPAGAVPAEEGRGAAGKEVVLATGFPGKALPPGFRAVEGNWEVRDGRLHGSSAHSGVLSRITFGARLKNFRMEVTARFESVTDPSRWAALGLDVPADGSVPWSLATVRSGTTAANGLEFARRTAGNTWDVTDTGPAPSAVGTGRDVRLAVEVHGSRARWSVDGREALRTSRVARSADGVEALVVNGATVSFDDLRITALPDRGHLRPPGAPLTVIAHRGASSAAPENTLVADEVGRRGGAEYIENDVQPSKDGVPYVLHDSTVDRTTDGSGAIRELTSAQLDALDAGSWFGPAFAGNRVPTLAAQLGDLRERGGDMLLEIKGRHTRDEVATIVRIIREQRMTDRVFVQSFEPDALRYTRDLAPELPLGLLRGTLDADPVAVARELGLTSYNPSDAALGARPGVVAELRDAGVAVMVWTVDSPDRWAALEKAGVDAVITNRPAELVGWNAASRQHGPTAPAVAVTSPAPGARLDRAQAPVAAVQSSGAASTRLTLDGRPVAAGEPLDLTALGAGEHTLRATVTGPGGTAAAESAFTLRASRTGLAHLILTSGAADHHVATLTTMLGHGHYRQLARWAEHRSGRGLPAPRAALIATEARALAGG